MNKGDTMDNKSILMDKLLYKRIGGVMIKYRRTTIHIALQKAIKIQMELLVSDKTFFAFISF